MPVAVSCTCGKSFHVKDELAGKKIKCPGCQAVVEVPAAGVAPAAPTPAAAPARAELVEDDSPAAVQLPSQAAIVEDDDLADRPRRGKKGKKAAQGGSKTMLFVGLGVGAVLLGLCCIGGGIGGYFLFLAGPGDPEKVIVGKWEYQSAIGAAVVSIGTAKTYEFLADGTCKTDSTAGFGQPVRGRWKILKKEGSTATVEITYDVGARWTETYDFTFTSNNAFELRVNRGDKLGMRFKRAS
jgi:hypothetical protein